MEAFKGIDFGRRPFLFRCIRIQEVENGCFKLLVGRFQHIQRVLCACDTELVEMATWASPLALTEITNFLSCGWR